MLTKVEIQKVPVPVRTPLPTELLKDPAGSCTLPPTVEFYFFDLDVWAKCLETHVVFYSSQLQRIKEANGIVPDVD